MKIKLSDKKTVILVIAFAIFIVVVLESVILINTAKIIKLAETEDSISVLSYEKPMISGTALYRLLECGGKIGIYDAKSSILIDTIDVFVASLPSADRKALKNGLDVFSFSELSEIINDFTS